MATAKYPGKCTRCGGVIAEGDRVLFFNRPVPRSIFHAQCPDGSTPQVEGEQVERHPEFTVVGTGGTTGSGAARGDLARIIADAVSSHLTTSNVDADEVRRIIAETAPSKDVVESMVRDALASRVPTVIEVKQPNVPVVTIEGAHYLMPRLLRLLGAGLHLYLWGPAGSGKTTAALQAAKALGRESELDTLDPSTFRSMIQGYTTPTGDKVHTTFTRCWEGGKVYVGDEADNAPGHVQTLFNSALANGHAPLAWGNVERQATFGFVGTGNTPGRPTREFPDRRPMSAAFADRLYFLYWPLDPAIECRAAGLPAPVQPKRKVHTCEPAAWVTWVQAIRAWAVQNAPTLMVTPRASLIGLQALTLGESTDEIADALVFRGADDELRSKALRAVPLP